MILLPFYPWNGKTFKKPRCPYEKEHLDAELKLKNPQRIFTGKALLRRMNRYGLLDESQNKLNYVLALTVENFLECRLQTLVFNSGMAKSIQHARVLIRQRHIRRVRSRSSIGRSVRPSRALQEAVCSFASRGICLF
ncbi:hypothetical protein UlMin_021251 [Ulmus minor]